MHKVTLKPYIVGFMASLILTLAAYFAVVGQLLVGQLLVVVILALAVAQLFVQAFFFLHLGEEIGPRWKLWAFISTLGIVLIVVVGAIWIMGHLNYNMMASPTEMNKYINSQDGL